MVERRASRRVPRLQPECKGPDHVLCVFGASTSRRASVDASFWNEVPDCEPADFTVLTVPERFAKIGDPHAGMDAAPGSLEKLLELADKDKADGLGDAPWPP